MGYHRAGFEVVGVDIKPQPNYPFEFVQGDALAVLNRARFGYHGLDWFAAIHASPPCQAFTLAQRVYDREHPDLVNPTRALLLHTGLPYVIENVKRAPLIDPVQLEGQMFPELRTHRPRWFETNWPLEVPFMRLSPPRNAKMGRKGSEDEWPQLVGHFADVEAGRKAMGIDWMNRDELAQAIPPAYTEFIGRQLLDHLQTQAQHPDPVLARWLRADGSVIGT